MRERIRVLEQGRHTRIFHFVGLRHYGVLNLMMGRMNAPVLLLRIHGTEHGNFIFNVVRICGVICLGWLLGRLRDGTHRQANAETIIAVFILFFNRNTMDHLQFSCDDHAKGVASDGFIDAWETSAVTPLVDFATESVSFVLEHFEFT